MYVFVVLNEGDYSIFDNTTPVSISLTQRQAQIILSLGVLCYQRNIWDDMSDSTWETISNDVAIALEALGDASP